MPTNTTVTSNYAGKVAGQIIGKAYKEGDTLSRNLVTLAPNVNDTLNMRKIQYTNGRVAYTCGFDDGGAITLSERTLTPVKLKNDISVCKEDFRATWDEDQFGPSAANVRMGSRIEQAIVAEALAEHGEEADRMIWQGDNGSNSNEWTGFEPLFTADGAVVKPTGPSGIGALAEDTVEQHLKIALAAIPVAVRRRNLVVAVSANVFQAYMFYLVSKGIANDGNTDPKRMGFGKYVLEEIQGLSDNKIVCYDRTNLLFGTGLAADHNNIAISDEDRIGLLTGKVRMKMVYNGGCQYYNSEDIVYYNAIAVA